jgi:hypothetical protein
MGRPEIVVNDSARSGDRSRAGSRTSRSQRCLAVSAVTLFMVPLHYSARIGPFRLGITRMACRRVAVELSLTRSFPRPVVLVSIGAIRGKERRDRHDGSGARGRARNDEKTPECRVAAPRPSGLLTA